MVYCDTYTKQHLATLKWDEFKVGAKALLLFFPLHTGLLLAWPGQVLTMLTALSLAAMTGSGLWM